MSDTKSKALQVEDPMHEKTKYTGSQHINSNARMQLSYTWPKLIFRTMFLSNLLFFSKLKSTKYKGDLVYVATH